jgi:hypothetical protein
MALHLALLALLARPLATNSSRGSEPSSPVITVLHAADLAEAPAAPLPRVDGPGLPGARDVSVDGFTFDVDKIARRRDALFPFITADAAFEALSATLTGEGRSGQSYGRNRTRALSPLRLRPDALQRLVDRTWSRRDRWNSFAPIRQLLETHDADAGDVSRLLKTYFDQNILQPYSDAAAPDPRVWVMLGLAADHVDFIDFVLRFIRDRGMTRASVELLLLLDKLVQGNRDALFALVDLDPEADAALTRTANPEAYDLLVAVRSAYRVRLASRALVTKEQIGERYDSVRLTILDAIISGSSDAYRVNDARYLAGAIHWRAGRFDAAMRLWRGMRPQPDDSYYLAESQLLSVIDSTATGDRTPRDARRVVAALDADQGRWLLFSVDRLHQFGFRFDTY